MKNKPGTMLCCHHAVCQAQALDEALYSRFPIQKSVGGFFYDRSPDSMAAKLSTQAWA